MAETEENASGRGSPLSETDSEGGTKSRKLRRKRGNGRYRPYNLSPVFLDDDEGNKEMRKRLGSTGMAPSNTTQFLLEDREARAGAEQQSEKLLDDVERKRVRSISGSTDLNGAASEQCTSSDEEELERDREFETSYMGSKWEAMEAMTKPELQEALLERDRDSSTLHDRCDKVISENRHLKELLIANGISFDSTVSSTTNHP